MLAAIVGPIVLFAFMYTAFALWRLRAQGRIPGINSWIAKARATSAKDEERHVP